MSETPLREGTTVKLDTGTRLAYERTFLAHENTQMAWIRTALSLITFGFTIAKFFEFLQEKRGEAAPLLGGQTVGTIMIGMGIIALIMGTFHHWQALKRLRAQCPDLPNSTSWVTAMLLTMLGLLALTGAIIRL